MSLIYKFNYIRDIKLLCNTLLLILIHILSLNIFNLTFEYDNLILIIIYSDITCFINVLKNLLCITLSYTFFKSINN